MKKLGSSYGTEEAVAVRDDGSVLIGVRGELGKWSKRRPAKKRPKLAVTFVAELTASGEPTWVTEIGSDGDDDLRSMVALPQGGVIVCGGFTGALLVDGKVVATAAGKQDVFVLALERDGKLRWSATAGGAEYDSCSGVAALPDGRIAAVGNLGGPARFGALATRHSGEVDAFVTLLDPAGAFQWVATGGGAASDLASSVAVTGEALFVTGSFGGRARFGDRTLELPGPPVQTANPSNTFVARYTLGGELAWAQGFGGADMFDRGWSIAALPDGSAVVAGDHRGDLFVARYLADGRQAWLRTAHGGSTARGVLALPGGDVLVAAYFGIPQDSGALELAAGSGAPPLTIRSQGSETVLARYSATGDLRAAGRLQGQKPHSDTRDGSELEVSGMAASPSGRLALLGRMVHSAGIIPGDLFAPTSLRLTGAAAPGQDTALFAIDAPE